VNRRLPLKPIALLVSLNSPALTEPGSPLIAFKKAAFQLGAETVFPRLTWSWRPGEQWAVLGPNGGGKSLFVQAIQGGLTRLQGEVEYGFTAAPGDWRAGDGDLAPEAAIVEVSPRLQRELARQESAYYQARWHSSEEQGSRTVGDFLSQASVERISPYELNARRSAPKVFARARRQYVAWLGLAPLMRRKLSFLSNGEQRKILLARALLESPRLLILDDPYGGLDVATRKRLATVISQLMRRGVRVLVATSRVEEIPDGATHVLLVNRNKVAAQGLKAEVLDMALTRRLLGGKTPRPAAVRSLAPHSQRSDGGRPVIELVDVRVEARGKTILKDITWTVREGERWALSGPNGAGKTTLLSLIQGDHPQVYAQNIRWFGAAATSTQSLWKTRQSIGWMSPELNLHYPVDWPCLEVVCSGFFNSIGLYHGCAVAQRAAARRWLRRMGLSQVANRPFGALSTGMQRLVLLCRAAVKQPRLMILDEPCQGIDPENAAVILRAIDRLAEAPRTTLIFVTHHRGELPRCISHRLELRRGRIARAPGLAQA
jgi:molybdate transport system ATP-binding protein